MDPLKDILDVERGIAERLETERSKAARWLEQATLEIDQAAQAEIARLEASAAGDETSAKTAAVEHAAAIVRRAESLAARMDGLDEERVKPIVWKHLAAIVPRADP